MQLRLLITFGRLVPKGRYWSLRLGMGNKGRFVIVYEVGDKIVDVSREFESVDELAKVIGYER